MRLHELTRAIDDEARLRRVTTEKAREVIARLAPQVLSALWDPDSKSYRSVKTDVSQLVHNYKGEMMYGSMTVEVEMVGWIRKTPVLRIYGRHYGYDTIRETNEIFLASVLKYLMERD